MCESRDFERPHAWKPLVAVALIATLPYLPGLGAPLQWDDRNYLLNSRFTWDWTNAPAVFAPRRFPIIRWPVGPTWRPLADLTHFVDYTLWAHRPPGVRVLNLALHALTAGLVYRWLCGFTAARWAWWGAALWALHPVNSEVVLCAFFRRASLATACMLAGLILWRRGRTWAALAAYGAALTAKESALAWPFLAAAQDVWLSPQPWREVRRAQAFRYAALAGVTAAYLLTYLWLVPTPLATWPSAAALFDNWRTALATVPTVARLILWPWPLAVDHLPRVTSLRVWGGAGLTGLSVVLIAMTRRSAPKISLGLLWGMLAHLPTAHLLPSGAAFYYLAERYLYAPLIGIALAVAAGLDRLGRAGAGRGAALAASIFATLILLRVGQWREGIRLYEGNVRQYPAAHRARTNLGLAYYEAGRFDEAAREYEAAIAAQPGYALAHLNLGACYRAMERPAEAETEYRSAHRLSPRDFRPVFNLGSVLAARGARKEAMEWFHLAARLAPEEPDPWWRLAQIARDLGWKSEETRWITEFRLRGGVAPSPARQPAPAF